MSTEKRLGIWMDHSQAHLMEFSTAAMDSRTITSAFDHTVKEEALGKSEHLMHNKERHAQAEYYKRLGEAISHYEEVILFGPTDAKTELFNSLRKDHRFEKIEIQTRHTDKMTENQQHAFVKDYFSKHL